MKNLNLKQARIDKDLSQQELAQLVGATRQTIGLIELGKYNPSLHLCLAICYAFEQKLDALFWKESDKI